jgi:hypothetical protein
MKRKAIMIGSPGPKNSVNYLNGVDTDLHHFINFLKSPLGGSWGDNELVSLYKCPSANLIELFQSINNDFLLVYFSGHGHYSLNETNIAINDSESLSVSQLISLIKASKALIIIDACRKDLDEEYSNFSGSEYLSFSSTLTQPNSSERYMQIISESIDGIAIVYGCSVGEISNENSLGGSYTYALLKTSLEWYVSQESESVLLINNANNFAHEYLKTTSNIEQNPQIVTVNSGNNILNLPFAIK